MNEIAALHKQGGLGILASQSGQNEEKSSVRVRRRRPRGSTEPADRQRAEAPRRRRDDAGGTGPPSGRPPRRPRPGGGKTMTFGGGLLGLVSLCVVLLFIFLGPSESEDTATEFPTAAPTRAADSSQPIVQPSPTPKPMDASKPTAASGAAQPPASSGEDTWLVMLYQDADDKVLEHDIYLDLNEAERVGSNDRLHIVAQVDRYSAGYRGDGDWSSAKRFYITPDQDLARVRSAEVADLGEVNMADGDTLVDFVTWAIETYPADKHVLILSDHGMGWPGGWTDPAPGGRGKHDIALAAATGDELFLMEMDEALEEIRARTGLDKFELIGLDACLMGHIEVFDALAPHALYAVASQETEPALGWAYTAFLGALKDNPELDGAELGRLIVDSYVQKDQRIVDDQARAEFLRGGSPLGGLFGLLGGLSAEELARQMQDDITLTAVDLQAMPQVMDSLNSLASALQESDQKAVAGARNYAQSFTSIFGRSVPPSYLDLGHLAQQLKANSRDADVAAGADSLLAALEQAVIAEKHGRNKPGATGISIYFPNSQLYGSNAAGAESYTTVARRFASESLWDDFLAYHYTGRSFEPAQGDIAVPTQGAAIRGPGTGDIQVAPITLSSDEATPDKPVLLSTEVVGDNVGYIKLFVGFYDQESNSIFLADSDYLESDDTREISGVYYPDWGDEGVVPIEFEWEPIVYAINDGADSEWALFSPETYGAAPEEAVYTVEGTYTFADGGETRRALLYFSNGMLNQVYGFTGEDEVGAPREIIPQPGDTFTILEKWIDLNEGGAAVQYATQDGATLTFGDEVLTWEEQWAPIGEYVVGFIVEDLDGNAYQSFTTVSVP